MISKDPGQAFVIGPSCWRGEKTKLTTLPLPIPCHVRGLVESHR